MAHLTKLTLTDKQRAEVKQTPEQRLRGKLIDRLMEQKELAEADLKGEQVLKTKTKLVKDQATGETKRIEIPKQTRRWWWMDEAGAVMLVLRYGNKPITIANDKATIEVGKLDELPGVFDTVIEATKAGELDKTLKAIVGERQKKR